MARYRSRQPTYRWVFALLLLLSLLAIFLPKPWTTGLINLVQVLLPLQDAAGSVADAAARLASGEGESVPRAAYEELERERAALSHQVAAMGARVSELEEQVSVLAKTRLWEVDGDQMGTQGQLVPARVLAKDLVAWRDARVISTGGLQGVRRGDAVTSQSLRLGAGSDQGLRTGLGVLLAEVLVGTVEELGTQACRVRLFSDPGAAMRVRVGRFTSAGFETSQRVFWMTGRGAGRMHIDDVERRDVDVGVVQVGDLVLSDRGAMELPVPLTIGTVAGIEDDRDNPLLVNVTVTAALDTASLQKVYVFVPERSSAK